MIPKSLIDGEDTSEQVWSVFLEDTKITLHIQTHTTIAVPIQVLEISDTHLRLKGMVTVLISHKALTKRALALLYAEYPEFFSENH